VIVYILLGGYPPFYDKNKRAMFRKIRKGAFEFHEKFWKHISRNAKDLISKMLTVDPHRRIKAEHALRNRWITQDDSQLSGRSLDDNLDELRKQNAKNKLKSAVGAVVVANKFNSLGKSLRNLLGIPEPELEPDRGGFMGLFSQEPEPSPEPKSTPEPEPESEPVVVDESEPVVVLAPPEEPEQDAVVDGEAEDKGVTEPLEAAAPPAEVAWVDLD
jgi:serine/threonine protein kinase